MEVQRRKNAPIDRGWAWVVLFSSFMCLMLTCGSMYSVGVFNVAFLETFGASSSVTSWIGSLLMGLSSLLGPVSSLITNRYGWRLSVIIGGVIAATGTFLAAWSTRIEHMFICFGLVSGIGHGLIYTAAVVVVGYYFDRLRTAATGIASVGAGLSMLLFPPLIQQLISYFSWREALVIAACIYLHICVFGALMRPLKLPFPDNCETGQEFEDVIVAKAQTRPHARAQNECCNCLSGSQPSELAMCKLSIFCISILLYSIGLSAVYLHLPAMALTMGASKDEASFLMSIVGGLSIFGRIFTGLAGNDKNIDNIILYIGTFGIAGIVTMLFPWVGSMYWGRIGYTVMFGFYGSCFNALLSPITVEIVGLEFLTTAFGIEMVVCGVGFLIGPPLAGWLFDKTLTYSTSFYLAGFGLIASSVVMMLTSLCTKPRGKHKYVTCKLEKIPTIDITVDNNITKSSVSDSNVQNVFVDDIDKSCAPNGVAKPAAQQGNEGIMEATEHRLETDAYSQTAESATST